MNRFAKQLIVEFKKKNNLDRLATILSNAGADLQMFGVSVNNYIDYVTDELTVSTPISGSVIGQHLDFINNRFIKGYLDNHGVNYKYKYSESTRPEYKNLQSAEDNLAHWRGIAAWGQQIRDDPQFTDYPTSNKMSNVNPEYEIQQTEDQDTLTDMFFDNSIRSLNDNSYNSYPFGYPENNEKLLQRKIFRNNNKIPYYERALYNRNYDRNIDESLSSTQYGNFTSKYDMSGLYKKISKPMKYVRPTMNLNREND